MRLDIERLKVLSTALTQFVQNAAERDDDEPEPPEIGVAQGMLDEVDLAIVKGLEVA